MLKRYAVFEIEEYYPSGGWDEFKTAYETLAAAKAHAENADCDRVQIVDLESLTLIYEADPSVDQQMRADVP